MTTNLINHLRSIMSRSDWEFHGQAVERLVKEAVASQPPQPHHPVIDSDQNASRRYRAVFVEGSLLHGFNVVGPFTSMSEAFTWSTDRSQITSPGLLTGVVMMLEHPDDYRVVIDGPEMYVEEQWECYGSS